VTAPARLTTLAAWIAGLTASIGGLLVVGRERPGSPPLLRPGEWTAWVAKREPIDSVAGIGRLVAVVLLAYLLVGTVVQLVAAILPSRRRRVRIPLTPAFVTALASALISSTTAVGAQPSPSVPRGAGATMEAVEDEPRTSLPRAAPDETEAGEAPEPQIAPPDPAPATREWVVRPGDHLWGIAEQVLAQRGDADPTDAEVHRYWVRVIRANLDRLVDPDDPDLILPGQRITLP